MDRFRAIFLRSVVPVLAILFLWVTGAVGGAQALRTRPTSAVVRPRPASVGVADSGTTWPSGVIYYQIVNNPSGSNWTTALTTFNSDFSPYVTWQEGTGSGTYVEVNLSGSGGQGDVNTIGYPQFSGAVTLNCAADCPVATLLHEMGHIIGLYHEMTRTDRDSYVTVNYDNAIKGTWPFDFAINMQNQQLLAPYDYASVMQYPSYVDTRNGGPVIETIPAGIPLQGAEGVPGAGNQDYSAADKEAILRLYGHAPTSVTVTSNPVGLTVVVDSVSYTTPHTFTSWTLNSTHSLSVPSGVQTLTGPVEGTENNVTPVSTTFYYTYGRWSDTATNSHTITVTPGNGSPPFPATSPAIATYTANFVQLVNYSTAVTPASSGSVSVSPQPQPYLDTNSNPIGNLLVARQAETLTATPASGYNFYEFNATAPYIVLPGGLSANPKPFFVPDTGNPVSISAEFSNTPVYTVNVVPADPIQNESFSNLRAVVDGVPYYTPQNFSSTYDPSWTAGSTTHTLSVASPQTPYSVNTEFLFSSWSDGGAQSHGITSLPPASTNYTATVTPLYQPATNFSFPPCGGTAAITPNSSNGGFYPWGTQLTFSATPTTGWTFAGWTYDLTGTANPATLTARDETLVYANFNITDTPLTLTSLSPPSVAAGSGTITLTIYGSGFTADSRIVLNNSTFPAVTYVNSSELRTQVDASLIASAGSFDVAVENFPPGSSGCAVFAYDTFTVTASGSGSTSPTINWTPAAEIIYGDAGTSVLNATTSPPDIGTFTYSATPTGGGTAVDITGGTSSLPPGSYTLTATFTPTNPQFTTATASNSLIVAGETVWIVNGGGSVSELTGDGTAVSSSAYSGANLAIAIDNGGNVWSVGNGTSPLVETTQLGRVVNTISSGGGLSTPVALAIDGGGQVWIANGNSTISLFSNDGAAVSPAGGFTDSSLHTPSGIAIDLGGSVWITNKSSNTLTRILGAAAPAAPLSTAAANNTTGARP